jgi:outer membrane protein TolC
MRKREKTGLLIRSLSMPGILVASFLGVSAFVFLTGTAHAQLSLYTTVDLARRNSTAVRIAQADVAKAQASVSETRDVYIPSLAAGSAAGYSYGFLGGVPTVFNAQIQSLLISFSQPDYIRAARAGLHAATLGLKDALDQVELDTTLDYLQLNTITQQIAALNDEKSYAEKLDGIEQDRLSAGVESQIAATRAELTAAQADLKRLDLEAQAALLRKRLSDLTGLQPKDIQTEPRSVPGAPAGDPRPVNGFTAGVQAGYSSAISKHYVAHGDERVNYRPQIGLGFTYDFLDTGLNNYNQYYTKGTLRPNNFGIAAQITFPLFNAVNSAHARGSAADAAHADSQAEQGRLQAEEQVIQLQQSFPELRAQARIADLQEQLAQQQLQSVMMQLKDPPANPNAAPLNPADEMQSRIEERARFSDALDARFTLLKAQLSLLRTQGGLAEWVDQGARPGMQ